MVAVATVLGIVNWALNFIAILIFLSITITVIKYRRELKDISLVLAYNTCFAALLTCFTVCIMVTSNLSTGFLIYNLGFCQVWGLLYDIFECSIYHSYYVQAFYRLCRVVFFKKKFLISYSLYIILIIGQWSLTIVVLLPPVFLHWYTTLPTEHYCLVPYTDVFAETYHIVILYVIPIVCIGTMYLWITIFMRSSSRASTAIVSVKQRRRNLRDLTVIKRIVILISILVALRFPTVIFMIYAIIVGDLYPLTFGIVGLITSTCLIFIGMITIYITPQLKKYLFTSLIHHDNRVHVQQTAQQRLPMPSTTRGHVTPAGQNKSTNVSE
jgi:hypothetical protein